MSFDFTDSTERSRPHKPFPWGRLWLNTFTATFTAILLVQILNLAAAYMMYRHIAAKFEESAKPAATKRG